MRSVGILLTMGLLPNFAQAQDVVLPKDVLSKLNQQQSTIEERKATIVPAPNLDPNKNSMPLSSQSLQSLLKEVEVHTGAVSGTLKAINETGSSFLLEQDLDKARKVFKTPSQIPFGQYISQTKLDSGEVIKTEGQVEHQNEKNQDGVANVVSAKVNNVVAANAFSSGNKPVSVSVNNAGLTAIQVPSGKAELAVNVRVDGLTRTMNAGEIAHFKYFDVSVLASENRSNKVGYEGLPYILRLRVMPAQQ